MDIQALKDHFSPSRIGRYEIASKHLGVDADELYKFNILISQSFYPLLAAVEVLLRNRLDGVLSNHFKDENWIINQKKGFMSDPYLYYLDKNAKRMIFNDFLKSSIEKSEIRFRRRKVPVTKNNIIADQNFGFWSYLFEIVPYKLLSGKPIKIFKALPHNYKRKDIRVALIKIQSFRNRVYHNEPICFKGDTFNLINATEIYESIKLLIDALAPELKDWLQSMDNVGAILKENDF